MRTANTKKKLLLTVALVVVVGVAGWMLADRRSETPDPSSNNGTSQVVSVPKSGITYPSGWTEATEITVTEHHANVISKAIRGTADTKVILRATAGELPANFKIEDLPEQLAVGLAKEIEGFRLVSKRTVKYGELEAAQLEYTQVSSADQKVNESSMFVVPTQGRTFYVTYSSANGLSDISKGITDINKEIAAYISSQITAN